MYSCCYAQVCCFAAAATACCREGGLLHRYGEWAVIEYVYMSRFLKKRNGETYYIAREVKRVRKCMCEELVSLKTNSNV